MFGLLDSLQCHFVVDSVTCKQTYHVTSIYITQPAQFDIQSQN